MGQTVSNGGALDCCSSRKTEAPNARNGQEPRVEDIEGLPSKATFAALPALDQVKHVTKALSSSNRARTRTVLEYFNSTNEQKDLSKKEFRSVAVVKGLVRVLQDSYDFSKPAGGQNEMTPVVVRSLRLFARHPDNNRAMAKSGVIPVMVDMLREDASPVVREQAVGVLRNLGSFEENRKAMAEAGCLKLLVEMLRNPSPNVKEQALAVMQNLAAEEDLAKQMATSDDVIPIMVDQLTNGKEDGRKLACATLLNIVCFFEGGRQMVAQASGIPPLCRILEGPKPALAKGALHFLAQEKDIAPLIVAEGVNLAAIAQWPQVLCYVGVLMYQ